MGRKIKFKSLDLKQQQKIPGVTRPKEGSKVPGNQSHEANPENIEGVGSGSQSEKEVWSNLSHENPESNSEANHNIDVSSKEKVSQQQDSVDTGYQENRSIVEVKDDEIVENETWRKNTGELHGYFKDSPKKEKYLKRDHSQKKFNPRNNQRQYSQATSNDPSNSRNDETGRIKRHSHYNNDENELFEDVPDGQPNDKRLNISHRDQRSQQSQRHSSNQQTGHPQMTFHNKNRYGNSGNYHHNERDNNKFPRPRNLDRSSYKSRDNYDSGYNRNQNDRNSHYRGNWSGQNYPDEDKGRDGNNLHRRNDGNSERRNDGNSERRNDGNSERRNYRNSRGESGGNSDYKGNQRRENYEDRDKGRGENKWHGKNEELTEGNDMNRSRENNQDRDKGRDGHNLHERNHGHFGEKTYSSRANQSNFQQGGRGGRGRVRHEQEPKVGWDANQIDDKPANYVGYRKTSKSNENITDINYTEWNVENTTGVPRPDTRFSGSTWNQDEPSWDEPRPNVTETIPTVEIPKVSNLNPNAASFAMQPNGTNFNVTSEGVDKKYLLDDISTEMQTQCAITRVDLYENNEGVISKGSELTNRPDTSKRSRNVERFDHDDRSLKRRESLNQTFLLKDEEYEAYKKFRLSKEIKYNRVVEEEKDLFTVGPEYSLAHCVAADMRMGSGIAVKFCQTFKSRGELLQQNRKQGDVAVLTVPIDGSKEKRHVYYMVTKTFSSGKPTYESLWTSMKKMREHIIQEGVKKLAIPRIGCGLDRLEWKFVKPMLEYVFRDVDIEILVCVFQQEESASPSARSSYSRSSNTKCKVVVDQRPITEIEELTIIVYFATPSVEITPAIAELDKRFNFLLDFKKASKKLGEIVRFDYKNGQYLLYGCIVVESTGGFDFTELEKCLRVIQKENRKNGYEYVAFQRFDDDDLNEKILSLMRSTLKSVDIYCCAPAKSF